MLGSSVYLYWIGGRHTSRAVLINAFVDLYACVRVCEFRLQDMEIQYRKEKEEADLLLEQHRLV